MKKNYCYIALVLMLLSGCGQTDINKQILPVLLSNGAVTFINSDGETVLNPTQVIQEATFFYEGKSLVSINDGSSETLPTYKTFINTKGEPLSDKKYKYATIFQEGIAWVVEENAYPSAINGEGKTLFSLKNAERVGVFSEGLALAYFSENGSSAWGYVNRKGEIVIPPRFYDAGYFHEGLSQASESKDEGYGYIDKKGNFVINPQFSEASHFNKNGLAVVAIGSYDDRKYGVINKKGKFVIQPQYDNIILDGDIFMVRSSGVYGWIDTKGKIVINPQFKRSFPFHNSSVTGASSDGEKFGIINKKGEYILTPQYDAILSFIGGVAPFVLNGKGGFINKKGKIAVNPQYENISIDYMGMILSSEFAQLLAVETDFCNIESVVSNLMNSSKPGVFRGISKTSTFGQIKDLYKGELSNNTPYSRRNTQKVDLGEGVSITRTIFKFDEVLSKSSYNFYERKYDTEEMTQARINAVECKLEIEPFSRAYKKNQAIIKALTDTLNSLGLTFDISSYESTINLIIYFKEQ